MKLKKVLTYIVLCVATIIGVGLFVGFGTPFCCWATGISIGGWLSCVTVLFLGGAAYSLWQCYAKKSWNMNSSLWIIAMLAFVFLGYLAICRYGADGHFQGDYILVRDAFDDDSERYGLINKYNREIVWCEYDEIYRVVSKKNSEEIFVGVDCFDDSYIIQLFDKNGNYLDFNDIGIGINRQIPAKDNIELFIGEIIETYTRDRKLGRINSGQAYNDDNEFTESVEDCNSINNSYNEKSEEKIDERLLERQEAIFSARQHEESDGFTWYSYEYNGKTGIVNADGEILIWENYDMITYRPKLKIFRMRKPSGSYDIATSDYCIRVADVDLCEIKSTATDRRNNTDNKRYWIDVARKENGIWLHGAYDKNWKRICPPIFQKVDYLYENYFEDEYFYAKLDDRSEYAMIFNYKMDSDGNLIKKENPVFINYYACITDWGNGDKQERIEPIVFYKDHVIFDCRNYPYYRNSDGVFIYKKNNEDFIISVDKDYNVHTNGVVQRTYEQVLTPSGDPFYNSVIEKAMRKWAEYDNVEVLPE